MKTVKIILVCVLFAAGAFVISCKKSDTTAPASTPPPADTDISGANDNTLADNTSSDAVQMGAEATDNGGSLTNYRLSNPEDVLTACATVAVDSAAHTVTVSFNGGVCMDGRVRSGSIIYNFTGSPMGAHYRTPGFMLAITSNNYVVDSNQVTINHTVLNTTPAGFDSATTNETWTINGSVEIIKPSGDTINWTCNRVKTLLNTSDPTIYRGQAIPIDWSRARVGITGNANGSRSGGETFNVNITTQLVRDFGSCRILGRVPFIIGKLTYTPSTKKYPRYIDYAAGAPGSGNNGACDLWASVTINGITYLFLLL